MSASKAVIASYKRNKNDHGGFDMAAIQHLDDFRKASANKMGLHRPAENDIQVPGKDLRFDAQVVWNQGVPQLYVLAFDVSLDGDDAVPEMIQRLSLDQFAALTEAGTAELFRVEKIARAAHAQTAR